MDAFDKAVERLTKAAEFVLAMDAQAASEIAFAFGDVMHRPTHNVQRLHQYADQQAEQGDDDQYRNHRGNNRRGTQLAEHGEGEVLVELQGDIPVGRRHTVDLGEGDELRAAITLGLLEPTSDLRRALRVGLIEVFEYQFGIGVHQNLAGAVNDERLAMAIEVQRVDDRTDAIQVSVGTADADHPALMLHWCGQGDHQLVCRGRNVGLGNDGLASSAGGFIPTAYARVVVGRSAAQR
ncbi:hypothetical protein D3C77_460580 [compost metagenome]